MAELFKVNAPVRKPLFEGVQGENEARSIQFDITPWVEELGDGAVTATAKRSQDSQPYPVTVTKDGNTVTWKPTSTDTAYAGVGSFQLEYTVDDVLAKTCIWSTMVAPSLDPAGDPPDPYDNWLAEMREIAADAIQAAQDADASADAAAASAEEASGVKDLIDEIAEIETTFTNGVFVHKDHGQLISGSAYSASDYIACGDGLNVFLDSVKSTNAYIGVAFYNEYKEYVSGVGYPVAEDTTFEFTCPVSGYFRFTSNGHTKAYASKLNDSFATNGFVTAINEETTSTINYIEDLTFVDGKVILSNGAVQDSTTYSIAALNVSGKKNIKINTSISGYAGIVFLDINGNIITGQRDADGVYQVMKEYSVSIPDNAYYLMFSCYTSVKGRAYAKYTNMFGAIARRSEYIPKAKDTKDYVVTDLLSLKHDIVSADSTYEVLKDYNFPYGNNKSSYYCDPLENDLSQLHEYRFKLSSERSLMGTQEFDIMIHSENSATINITLALAKENTGSHSVSSTINLKRGWNKLRMFPFERTITWYGNFDIIRLIVNSNPTKEAIRFGAIYQVQPPKGKLIVVDDHSYYGFMTVAYPQLKSIGVPTTWGLKITELGSDVGGGSRIITEEEVETLANDSFSEFSFHSWDGTADSSKTETQLRDEITKCLHYLRKKSLLPHYFWRCACVQNNAPAMAQIKDAIDYCAMYDETSNYAAFPFKDNLNIPRFGFHGYPQSTIDTWFDVVKKTHCTIVLYTHDISDAGGLHATTAEFDYVLSKITTGINEGWLEGTTINRLFTKYGTGFDPC